MSIRGLWRRLLFALCTVSVLAAGPAGAHATTVAGPPKGGGP